MNQLRFSVAMASLVLASGLMTAAPAAKAATGSTYVPGSACQAVLPGSNPKLSHKATGIRNESTTASSYVVCPLPSTVANGSTVLTNALLSVYSIDGASHEVTCTAVTGFLFYYMQYSSKIFTVAGTNNQATPEWTAADFGGTAGGLMATAARFQ